MATGTITKTTTYLSTLKTRIAPDVRHPRHHGVKMQAHHILSAEGAKLSQLGRKLVGFGYDINVAKNLAFLPCTLQGACYLGIQPHRGNHTALSDGEAQDEFDDDDAHPRDYHALVARAIKRLEVKIDKKCTGRDGDKDKDAVMSIMNDLSQEILMLIYGKPNRARLTKVADSFLLGNTIGCSGADSVGSHSASRPCPVHRNHYQRQRVGQTVENITFELKDGRYVPRPGR
ncbi:AHH domain-containing protein [Piscinibacter terrae]|uniref:Uncharacterized protein n=1 Tax=Piscinibacter terrae TaxID=2496871 RepID=A0A3N7HPW5_9BURK|nr:AHH domain-containing protein [Albitalea terrae]RQP24214.1 hypothetical protein DZC73_12920 [Albitalea terrae]